MFINNMMTKHNKRIIYPALSVLIPCIFGIVGMVSNNVSIVIWMQNPLAILLLTFAGFFVLKCKLRYNYKAIVLTSIVLLGMTFLGPDMDGVHRWLGLSFFTLNMSAIVVPITIIALYRLIVGKQIAISMVGTAVIAFLLFLQPDASQLLAFSLPMIVLLLKSDVSKITTCGLSGILLFLTAKSWSSLDTLQPVDYVEGVLTMLRELSIVLYIAGLAALFWIPICFLVFGKEKNRNECTAIALYYLLMVLSTFAGSFPVPFMGYGISPILGFYAVIIWFACEDKYCT